MIFSSLMLTCMLIGGMYLLAISIILYLLENKMKLGTQIPASLLEKYSIGWFVINYIMEFMFFIVIPAMAFGFFYVVLPLDSIRSGMAVALTALILGTVPIVMSLTMRIKLPLPFLIYTLLGYFLKVSGSLIIIGYLYSL